MVRVLTSDFGEQMDHKDQKVWLAPRRFEKVSSASVNFQTIHGSDPFTVRRETGNVGLVSHSRSRVGRARRRSGWPGWKVDVRVLAGGGRNGVLEWSSPATLSLVGWQEMRCVKPRSGLSGS